LNCRSLCYVFGHISDAHPWNFFFLLCDLEQLQWELESYMESVNKYHSTFASTEFQVSSLFPANKISWSLMEVSINTASLSCTFALTEFQVNFLQTKSLDH
jgi:hypothetical protein